MSNSYKEQLSEHVESIFKSYITPGLHICDIATGGGKSYTIGKLTCQYYPNHFDRIIILCVQTKLVKGMNSEIEKFLNEEGSLIRPDEKMVIENNSDVIANAVRNNYFTELLEEIDHIIGEQKRFGHNVKELQYSYGRTKKIYDGLSGLIKTQDNAAIKSDYLNGEIEKSETALRNSVRSFFDIYKRHLERTKQKTQIKVKDILRQFPALSKVYPQAEYNDKKVLLMTVHKAMYGIDPILSEKIRLADFSDKKKKTLILFDESDQAATAIRSTIIDQAIESSGGSRRFAKGYNGYLQYRSLIENPEHVSTDYYGNDLEDSLRSAKNKTQRRWETEIGKIEPYKNIFLNAVEDLETYRRGVFFSGPTFKLNISSQSKDKSESFVCHKKGDRHLRLVHSDNEEELKKQYDVVVPMSKFLSLVVTNTTTIMSYLRKVITDALQKSRDRFEQAQNDIRDNKEVKNMYLGWPTLEREIHTLFSRFETTSEYQFEQQINEFITNRKNISVKHNGEAIKLPDYSVYSQGVQLFMEEIDERDNQHRVRLSCREIQNTPEKIFIDLVNSGSSSVVLCSATASSGSVVNNCDIRYLKQVLGDKVHTLSTEQMNKFDNLSNATYPVEHNVEILPIKYQLVEASSTTQLSLPEGYKEMFSEKAIKDGLVERWFKFTKRSLENTTKDMKDLSFQLYRLLQFIEVYHNFIEHDDIHSMLFFQNRTGDKDNQQYTILACLIDGSYEEPFEDELPTDWTNDHLCFSKDWEEVEGDILKKLQEDKDAKLMLVSAYGSFKAGANMQYVIPEGLENCISGDYWDNGKEQKKDWDAIFLQSPTNYLTLNEDGIETTFEKGLYNAMLTLMMLNERGWLSPAEVNSCLCRALAGNLFFGEKNNPGIAKDKAAWAQTIVEQAVGRLCRTRNKPQTTYIMYDESMTKYFYEENLQKSLTKEFKALAEYILAHSERSKEDVTAEEQKLCNDANKAQRLLNRLRRVALKYTPHPEYLNDDEYENGDEVSYQVRSHQIMNQSYKRTIIKKPVINSLDELDDEDKNLTFIGTCYGAWLRDDNNTLAFKYDKDKALYVTSSKKTWTIRPSDVRLDVLMKNDVIRRHFERNGYATDWKPGALILHPRILACDYAGEIGEEAFKAIVLDCNPSLTEENFKHLEGKDYELADFIICDKDGKNRIAFDVKNMRVDTSHEDQLGDLSTSEKRKIKEERLGCPLITVNMLQRKEEEIDALHEIGGVIDEDGQYIHTAIEQIRKYVTIEQ